MLCVKCRPGKEYLVHVDGFDEKLIVLIIDNETQEVIHAERFSANAAFVKKIPTLFNNQIKAVILNIFRASPPDFSNNLEFCEAIRQQLASINLPYRFVCHHHFIISSLLLFNDNLVANIGDSVTFVVIYSDYFYVYNSELTAEGCKVTSCRNVQNPHNGVAILYERILRAASSKTVIATSRELKPIIFDSLKKHVSNIKNFITFEFGLEKCAPKFACEMYQRMKGGGAKRNYIIPTITRTYSLRYYDNSSGHNLQLIDGGETLPFTATYIVGRQNVNSFVTFIEEYDKPPHVLQKLEFDNNCHVHKFILSVDINNFPIVTCESTLLPQILALPKKFNVDLHDKCPVIGIRKTYSFICVFNEDKGKYEFLDEWNGVYGRPLFISFDEKKSKYCEEAVEVYKTKSSFAVYDLIHIMSVPIKGLHMDTADHSNWSFGITKDDENPLLLEFDNFDGTKKAASPQFLFAMLLKQHVKAIKEKTGEKPKKLACCIVDLHPRYKCVIESIYEAFQLLKIDVISLN